MSSSAKTPGDRLVEVIITQDNVAVMDPAVPILESVLQYRRKSYAAGGPLGYQEVVEDVALCEFDLKGRLLGRHGTTGSEAGKFFTPWGIAHDGKSRAYIADTGNRRVVVVEF